MAVSLVLVGPTTASFVEFLGIPVPWHQSCFPLQVIRLDALARQRPLVMMSGPFADSALPSV